MVPDGSQQAQTVYIGSKKLAIIPDGTQQLSTVLNSS
jgi:hypothetical protein